MLNHLYQQSSMDTTDSLSPFITDNWNWDLQLLSNKVKLVNPSKQIICFHPLYSRGTAGIRGNKILNKGQPAIYYWEIKLVNRVYGTSMMFGIGTKKCRLYTNSFVNMIGEDDQGWALSHKGLLWHKGKWRPYTTPFRENETTLIGLLFDSYEGTLSFFKDGMNLGVAFTGLQKVANDLYPIVCSTAAKTEMRLCKMYKAYHNLSLQQRCRDVITKGITKVDQLNKLYLPPNINTFLKQNLPEDANEINKMDYSHLNLTLNPKDDYSTNIESDYPSFTHTDGIELMWLPTYLLI